MKPPAWLSLSYSPQEFSLGNYTAAHWVSYQPSARNLWEGIVYQPVQVELKTQPTLTTNPGGIVDVNLGDGTITLGKRSGNTFFIQPLALSFGWGSSFAPFPDRPDFLAINQTVVDFDIFGDNFLSLKVSHAEGYQLVQEFYLDGTKVRHTLESNVNVTMNVHRWPRVIVAVVAVYVLFEAGVLEAVYAGATLLTERIASVIQQASQILQRQPIFQP